MWLGTANWELVFATLPGFPHKQGEAMAKSGVDRRDFLKAGLAASAGALVLPELLEAQAQPGTAAPSMVIEEITLEGLRRGMAAGRFTARSLVEHYTSRINAIDKA